MPIPEDAMRDMEFAKAARVSYYTLIGYEKAGFLKPVAIEKAVRFYSPKSLSLIAKIKDYADGKRNLRAAYKAALREAAN